MLLSVPYASMLRDLLCFGTPMHRTSMIRHLLRSGTSYAPAPRCTGTSMLRHINTSAPRHFDLSASHESTQIKLRTLERENAALKGQIADLFKLQEAKEGDKLELQNQIIFLTNAVKVFRFREVLRLFVRLFIRSLVHSFARSFICSFICPFVHPFMSLSK